MTDTAWAFVALGGLAVVFLGNVLRARRTDDMSCLGHVFVASDQMTTTETILNRTGMLVFALGVVVSLML